MGSLLKNGVISLGSSVTANTTTPIISFISNSTMIFKNVLVCAIYQEKEMLIDLAKMAKIHKFGLANSLLD